MHFVRISLDIKKLDKLVTNLSIADASRFHLITRIISDNGDVWVSKSDLANVQELVGDAINKIGEFNYKDYSNIMFIGAKVKCAIPIMINVVRELVDIVGFKKVYVCYDKDFESINKKERNDPKNLVIILNSLPTGLLNRYGTREINVLRFGMITTYVPHTIKTTFKALNNTHDTGWSDRIIRDDDGVGIAIFKGNRIWICFDIAKQAGRFDENWYPTMIIREIIARCLAALSNLKVKPLDKVDRIAVLEACRTDFIKNAKSDVNNQKRKLEIDLSDWTDSITILEEEIAKKQQQIRKTRILFDALLVNDNKNDVLNKEFDLIKNHIPLLRNLSFIKNGIIFETEDIYLEGDTSTKKKQEYEPFSLGRYKIELLRGKGPYVTNVTERLTYAFMGTETEWDHPHVRDHHPCLGNISSEVSKLIREDKWFGAITYIIEALKSYNSDDGWSPIGLAHWQAAAQERKMAMDMNEDKKDRIKGWASYRHRMPLGLSAMIDTVVKATCPNTCPLKDLNKCTIQGDGTREGTIKSFYEDHIMIVWENDNEKKVGCHSFTYESVTFPDGSPIVQAIGEVEPQVVEVKPKPKAVIQTLDPKFLEEMTEEKVNIELQHLLKFNAERVVNNLKNMQKEQEENPMTLPTINLQGEDVPDMKPDERWADVEGITPEDDAMLEAFNTGIKEGGKKHGIDFDF